jgi:MYXO-CTERM domain-containing protein
MTQRQPRQPQVPPDPSGIQEPHDVLAADEFGIGTRDERLPPDPTGIQEPHDVLAAEEFAMPAGAEPHDEGTRPDPRTLVPLVLLAALVAFLLLRRRA